MQHHLHLQEKPFERIKTGRQTIEMRLFDEKRSKLDLGDHIQFSKRDNLSERIQVEVIGLLRYRTFRELIQDIPPTLYGYPLDFNKDIAAELMRTYYSEEDEQKYGVLGIKIKLI
ncbi:hypothetical protein HY495_00720 [Candidatus Woesearchaeota archaeon]|nr:hypothetical protein [Candidatus Woesearchaeota archaeon]